MANIQKRYAYCMGANHPQGFEHLHTLQYAERDAELLARALRTPPCAFTETRHVIADNPMETMLGLSDFLQQPALQDQDLVVVHFSGHGRLSNGKLHLLCNQTQARAIDISAINIDAIKDRLAECRARYKLLILDCCHSGGATEGALKGAHEVEEELNHALRGSSNVILAACARFERTRELAVIDGEEGGGVLSWIMRAACTTRMHEIAGGKRSLSLTDIRGWIPGVINKINSSLPEGEEHLPQPITFYEGQGGAEIWLTEAGKYSGKSSQSIDTTARLQGIVDSQRDFVDDRVGRFVGRELELRDLEERIAGTMEQGGYVIITGDAGQGKSSIIAKMIEQRGIDTCAYHFVQYNSGDDYRTNLLRKLLACLILKYQLPDYYIDSESYPVLSGNFSHVLAEIGARGEREVIYIDGLDQLTTQATIEQGLGFLPARLPPGIVIVLGTRPNDTWRQLKRAIGAHDADLYWLGMLSRADFELLLQPRDEPLSPTLVERFYQAMQGNALYLDLLAQELKGKHDSRPEELIAQVENNPNDIFTITFSRMKQPDSEWHGVIRPLLGALLVAREALTQQQIGHICSVETYRIKDATTRLGGLLTRLSHERYTLFHRKLYEYLREDRDHPDEEYEFDRAEERRWHGKLATWCGQGANELLWSEDVDPLDQEDYREYARKHYVAHLHYARDYPGLFTVLDDGEYERGKLHADPSTRSTVLDLMVGCEDAARVVPILREGGASLATGLSALARLWRYTLLRCSLETQADTYPGEAFQALLALNRERQALDLAELLTQPMRKVAALMLVMQHLLAQPTRTAEGLQLYDRVYEVAASITENSERVEAFARLAVSLQRANQEEKAWACWQEASTAVDTITDSSARAGALRKLAEAYMQAHMWEQARTTASMIDSAIEQIEAWGHLMLALRQAGLTTEADRAHAEMQTVASGSTEQAELDRAKSLSALALAQTGQFKEARRVAGEIRHGLERDVTVVRIEAGLAITDVDAWERSWHSIDTIVQKYARSGRVFAQLDNTLVDLSIELARQERWEQAQTIAIVMSNKEAQCRALMGIVSQLARHGQSKLAEDNWNKARALCNAQIDMVEARVAGIVVSALVKGGQIIQAREITSGISDHRIREHVTSEFALALASVRQIEDAKTIADSIVHLQDKDHAYGGIARALMEAGESEQAQMAVSAIHDRNRQRRVLDALVTICCDMKQWEAAQTTASLIDDPYLQAEVRSRILSGLVRAGQPGQAEVIVNAMPANYFKFRAICDVATAFAQFVTISSADKHIRALKRNKEIQKKAECNSYIAANWLAGAEATAKTISEGSERREALCNVAIAYARDQSWDKAQEVVAMIHDRHTQDEAREVLAVELARAGQWEGAVTTLDEIQKSSHRRTAILQIWGTLLAPSGSREQREKIERHLNESQEKAGLLVSVADTLAQAGQYPEQLQVVQHAWLQASTKDDCLNLFAMVQGLIVCAPEMGTAFYDAFTWVDAFLSD